MNKQEQLTKLIGIAVENGWLGGKLKDIRFPYEHDEFIWVFGNGQAIRGDILSILFNYDFAKAIWGEDFMCRECGSNSPMFKFDTCSRESCPLNGFKYGALPSWQYHLRQAITSEDLSQYYWDNK